MGPHAPFHNRHEGPEGPTPPWPPWRPRADDTAVRLETALKRPRPRLRLLAWFCLALGVFWLQVRPHLDTQTTSFPGYWVVARELRSGTPARQLYEDGWLAARMAEHGFAADRMLGPPTLALTALPVSGLDADRARIVWMTGVLWPALVGSLFWLCRGLPLGTGLALGGALALSRPVTAGMAAAQTYPLLLLAHAGALAAWRSGRTGGALWLSPLVLLRGWHGLPQAFGWLWAGRPKATAVAAAGVVLGGVLTLPWIGTEAWLYFFTVQSREVADSPDAFVLAYQTWRSLALHLTTLDPLRSPDPPLVGLGPSVWLVGVAGIVGAALWAGRAARPGQQGLGFALWTTVALLLAPFAEDHHFVLAAVPVTVLWTEAPAVRPLVSLALVFLLPAWPFDQPGLLGGWRALAGYPRVWGTLVLFAACVRALCSAGVGNPTPAPAS